MPLRRAAWALALVATALGCGRRAPTPQASSASASVVPPPSPAPGSASPAPPPLPPSFEVEFEGKLLGAPPAARYVVIVTPEPCTADNLGTVPTIAIGEGRRKPAGLVYWTEGNVREGSRGYVCAFALNARGRATAFGAHPRSPLLFAAGGKDDLEFEDVDIPLRPLDPPRELPPQRF